MTMDKTFSRTNGASVFSGDSRKHHVLIIGAGITGRKYHLLLALP